MIFAIADLLRYRLRLQHYGDDPSKNILALGHTNRVADETLKMLAPGDIIVCQRINSLLSWAVMYFGGGYAVDHAAVYLGDGKVLHATLSGVKEHSIHALAHGARILPFRLFGLDESDPGFKPQKSKKGKNDDRETNAHASEATSARQPDVVLPPHLQLLLAGIAIVLGLRPTSFRWKYYIDIGLLTALLDLILWPINHFPMAGTIWGAWFVVLILMRVRFRKQQRSGHVFEPDSHPGLFIRLMWNQGGYIFPSQPINGRWKVRVWPARAAPSSPQQTTRLSRSQQSSPESSASDQ